MSKLVSSVLFSFQFFSFISISTFESFLAGLVRNQLFGACCYVLKWSKKTSLNQFSKTDNRCYKLTVCRVAVANWSKLPLFRRSVFTGCGSGLCQSLIFITIQRISTCGILTKVVTNSKRLSSQICRYVSNVLEQDCSYVNEQKGM